MWHLPQKPQTPVHAASPEATRSGFVRTEATPLEPTHTEVPTTNAATAATATAATASHKAELTRHVRVNIVPTLDEIVCSHPCALQPGAYSKAAFVDFLHQLHCAENLDFVLDADRFLLRFAQLEIVPFLDDEAIIENLRLARIWLFIYDTYICRTALREVNAPGKLLARFRQHVLPDPKELVALRKAVYELLSANYNEFITSTREQTAAGVRRPLEPIQADAMLDLPHELLSPDSLFNTVSPDLLAQWERTLETYENLKLASLCESNTPYSRANSAGHASTRPLSRGSSLGSVFDNLREYLGWRKTVKRLRPRRASSEKGPENLLL